MLCYVSHSTLAPVKVREGKFQLSVMLKQLPSTSSSSEGNSSSSTTYSKLAAVLSNEVCAQLFGMGAVAFKQVSLTVHDCALIS
jgi:hypothetical protein